MPRYPLFQSVCALCVLCSNLRLLDIFLEHQVLGLPLQQVVQPASPAPYASNHLDVNHVRHVQRKMLDETAALWEDVVELEGGARPGVRAGDAHTPVHVLLAFILGEQDSDLQDVTSAKVGKAAGGHCRCDSLVLKHLHQEAHAALCMALPDQQAARCPGAVVGGCLAEMLQWPAERVPPHGQQVGDGGGAAAAGEAVWLDGGELTAAAPAAAGERHSMRKRKNSCV